MPYDQWNHAKMLLHAPKYDQQLLWRKYNQQSIKNMDENWKNLRVSLTVALNPPLIIFDKFYQRNLRFIGFEMISLYFQGLQLNWKRGAESTNWIEKVQVKHPIEWKSKFGMLFIRQTTPTDNALLMCF